MDKTKSFFIQNKWKLIVFNYFFMIRNGKFGQCKPFLVDPSRDLSNYYWLECRWNELKPREIYYDHFSRASIFHLIKENLNGVVEIYPGMLLWDSNNYDTSFFYPNEALGSVLRHELALVFSRRDYTMPRLSPTAWTLV